MKFDFFSGFIDFQQIKFDTNLWAVRTNFRYINPGFHRSYLLHFQFLMQKIQSIIPWRCNSDNNTEYPLLSCSTGTLNYQQTRLKLVLPAFTHSTHWVHYCTVHKTSCGHSVHTTQLLTLLTDELCKEPEHPSSRLCFYLDPTFK